MDKEERLRQHQAYERDSIPVKKALERHGITVNDLYDILNCRYIPVRKEVLEALPLSREVIDTLLEQLVRTQNERVLEPIVRLIGLTREPYDARPLAELFDRSSNLFLKWAIGNTLSMTTPLNVEEWLPAALLNPIHDRSRQMLCVAIARVTPEEAKAVLKQVFDELPGHAAMGLGKCGGLEEAEFLRKKAESARGWHTWVKNAVKKAIERIEKQAAKQQAKLKHGAKGPRNAQTE